jgi:hypothetical protein
MSNDKLVNIVQEKEPASLQDEFSTVGWIVGLIAGVLISTVLYFLPVTTEIAQSMGVFFYILAGLFCLFSMIVFRVIFILFSFIFPALVAIGLTAYLLYHITEYIKIQL